MYIHALSSEERSVPQILREYRSPRCIAWYVEVVVRPWTKYYRVMKGGNRIMAAEMKLEYITNTRCPYAF